MPVNGSAPPIDISNQSVSRVDDWSSDGRTIIASIQNTKTGWDVYSLPVDGQKHDLVPVLNSPSDEISPRLSPDGHWLAYISNESGRPEVYVVSFPGAAGRRQVSNSGSLIPGNVVWSRDGKQLYFSDPAGAVMAADVHLGGGDFRAELPRQIIPAQTYARPWAAAADGRILALVYPDQNSSPIMIVLNWDAEMKN